MAKIIHIYYSFVPLIPAEYMYINLAMNVWNRANNNISKASDLT